MPRTPAQPPLSPEAEAFTRALHFSGLKKAAVAEMVGVTPGLVSQWAAGRTAIPAHRAEAVARAVGADPGEISQAYRESVTLSGGPRSGEGTPEQRELAALRLDSQRFQVLAHVLAATLVRHLPAAALDAAATLRRQTPTELRGGVLSELAELLERAGKQ